MRCTAAVSASRDEDRRWQGRAVRSMALAGVREAHLVLRLLQHPSLRRGGAQRELDRYRGTLRRRVSKRSRLEWKRYSQHSNFLPRYNAIMSFDPVFQLVDLSDPYQGRRIRLLVGSRTATVRGTRRSEESGSSEVQFLHVRVRSGIGQAGKLVDICTAYLADMFASHR